MNAPDRKWQGTLPASNGHSLFVQSCGGETAVPVIILHGGPGSAVSSLDFEVFSTDEHYVVGFDQRGGGRSKPLGSLDFNMTSDLVADIDRVLTFVGAGRCIIFARSWGVELALRYAALRPTVCTGLLLFGCFLCDHPSASRYLLAPPSGLEGAWDVVVAELDRRPTPNLGLATARLIAEDPRRGLRAARALLAYERACVSFGQSHVQHRTHSQSATAAYLKIRMHYLRNDYFPDGRQWKDRAARLGDIPIEIVHGATDLICPLVCSQDLAAELPSTATLTIVPDGTHQAFQTTNLMALKSAADRLTSRLGLR
ncbi:MAG: alpha/beta fold hydrolase [Propylenella sp.]